MQIVRSVFVLFLFCFVCAPSWKQAGEVAVSRWWFLKRFLPLIFAAVWWWFLAGRGLAKEGGGNKEPPTTVVCSPPPSVCAEILMPSEPFVSSSKIVCVYHKKWIDCEYVWGSSYIFLTCPSEVRLSLFKGVPFPVWYFGLMTFQRLCSQPYVTAKSKLESAPISRTGTKGAGKSSLFTGFGLGLRVTW